MITLFAILQLLISCSRTDHSIQFNASAFSDDDGITRIWRKEQKGQIQFIITHYVPFSPSQSQIITRYNYLSGKLKQIDLQFTNDRMGSQQLRFDQNEQVVFNQWVLPDRKQRLTSVQINTILLQATQSKAISDNAITQGAELHHGYYQQNRIVDCQWERVPLFLSIEQQQQLTPYGRVSLAWIEQHKRRKLLLISTTDFCQQQAEFYQE